MQGRAGLSSGATLNSTLPAHPTLQGVKSLFASFSSEKEESSPFQKNPISIPSPPPRSSKHLSIMPSSDPTPILILGGTAEAYVLAEALAQRPELRVITSLAGRTSAPRIPAGALRLGGFGGPEGLADYLRRERIAAVVDATHPFASRMGWNAAAGCAAAGVNLLRLERPAWQPGPGDRWMTVETWDQAIPRLAAGARCVLLAIGSRDLSAFAQLRAIRFLVRAVEKPDALADFAQADFVQARGPFTLAAERDLLQTHGIDTIVCKNSGGAATDAKLAAARELGITVLMHARPQRPPCATVPDIGKAIAWLDEVTHP
jgi:precorrin-6A/cobalt-precorrin-6A reductase